MIRPSGVTSHEVPYAIGRFAADDDAYVINQIGGASPFGGMLCSLGSAYAVDISPNGFGRSWLAGSEITPPDGLGKAWYLRDRESGDVWSAFYSPSCEKTDEYEVSFSPGQVSVFCLKGKIASTLTIATVPECQCEIWYVKLENRSAKDRTIEFTTYAEPFTGSPLEAKYVSRDRALVMRTPLEAVGTDQGGGSLTFFHSSTLIPIRYQTNKSDFIGENRTLRNPQHLEDDQSTGADGSVPNAITSLTVGIDLPIEGEAEFGFCFGVSESAEHSLKVLRSFKTTESLREMVDASRRHWEDLSSVVQVETSDRIFDALVNTWLPYEAYSGWLRERNEAAYLDPSRVADVLRRIYPLAATAPDECRDSLLSFAAGLSILGVYTSDAGSLVELPPSELLWLAVATAGYVAETGDTGVLAMAIPLKEGPSLTLKEHCERTIRMCLDADRSSPESEADPLLQQVIRQWSLITEDSSSADICTQLTNRRLAERSELPEQRVLPRRVRYLQSVSPSLADDRVSEVLQVYLGRTEGEPGDASTACCVYSALVERVLGLSATFEGLTLSPSLPEAWCECDITRRFRKDTYKIHVTRSAVRREKGTPIVVDGEPVLGDMLPYSGGGDTHQVHVIIG